MAFEHKIFRKEDNFMLPVEKWKQQNCKLVFTNGCFDILHPGHLHYLFQASNLGNKLIVGLNSDESVKKQNKGSNRPINSFNFRSEMLSWYSFIDLIVEFDEETPIGLIEKITPHVLTKGGDYEMEKVVGYDHVVKNNGKVVILPFLQGYSSSAIIEKIKNS